MEQLEFEESLNRITETMSYSNPDIKDRIIEDEVSDKQPYFVNATVVYVVVESSGDSPQAMQCFLAESSRIVMAHKNCKDIICMEDRMIIIYSTAFKEELNHALDDVARIRSLAMIVTKIGKQHGFSKIKVGIGMDYGLVEMYMMRPNVSNSPKFAWRGPAIKKAQKSAEDANDELIISGVVWNNLSENNQKLFRKHSFATDYYRCNIVNVMMNNWLTK